ncbi:MAG: putative phosphatase [Herbinix sp.]|nr:putative phosphatase [Herbinix sp.]
MYKHIIWDFDGTLFDTYPVMGQIFKETLEEEGITEALDEIIKHMKISMGTALRHYENAYRISNSFIENYNKKRLSMEFSLCKPFDGIEDICKYIHAIGGRNYLYTHRGESAITFLKDYNLYDYFSDFITSKQNFERKPSPDAILYLLTEHIINPNEAIMIGDRDLDILSAKNAGIHACFFTDGSNACENSDYTINNFQQLYSIIGPAV